MTSLMRLDKTVQHKKNLLVSHVASANSLQSLVSILEFIPVQLIGNFISEQINQFNKQTINNAYNNIISIDDKLPCDLLQHILSFNQSFNTKIINKKWNKLTKQNDNLIMKQRQEAIKKYEFKHYILFDDNINDIWIIHPNRTQLTNKEINLKYKGPINNIQTAVNLCKSGDKLFIYDGVYTLKPNSHGSIKLDKNIQFIGIGNNVQFKHAHDAFSVLEKRKCYFQNITIECDHNNKIVTEIFRVCEAATLWIKNCKLKGGFFGAIIKRNGCLNVLDCEFVDITTPISISPICGNVNVFGCIFRDMCHNGKPCIHIDEQFYERMDKNDGNNNVKCVWNIFENINCFPIAEEVVHCHKIMKNSKRNYLFAHNILKGNTTFRNGNNK
eukprot:14162_1